MRLLGQVISSPFLTNPENIFLLIWLTFLQSSDTSYIYNLKSTDVKARSEAESPFPCQGRKGLGNK
jgi:hypothetical protein